MAKKVIGPGPKKKDPPKSKNGGATLIIFKNGKLGRLSHSGGPALFMDTTGYGKGRKEFDLITSKVGLKSIEKVQRKDVPEAINKLKKGATIIDDRRIKTKTKK